MLEDGAYLPEKAHETDAGYDLRTPIPVRIPAGGSATIDTGVHIAIPEGFFGKLESKSGLNVKHNIVSLGGVIDAGYTGSVVIKLYNLGKQDYIFQTGEKIVQMIIQPCANFNIEQVKTLGDTERGDKGFGSSGR
jgi:dUTP pyrophosphatase